MELVLVFVVAEATETGGITLGAAGTAFGADGAGVGLGVEELGAAFDDAADAGEFEPILTFVSLILIL